MKEKNKRIRIGAGITFGLVVSIIFAANLGNFDTDINVFNDVQDEVEEEIVWQKTAEINPLGENNPGAGVGGVMSIFWLDYGQVPQTVLANNATNWETSPNTHAYEDTDGTTTDTKSEDPSYIVVRCCFTQDQAMSGGNWNASRTRATLTCSGDETISQTIVGNNSVETYGGGIESENNSDYNKLYINFYFDDNSDGYRILDDGSVVWSVVIEAKY